MIWFDFGFGMCWTGLGSLHLGFPPIAPGRSCSLLVFVAEGVSDWNLKTALKKERGGGGLTDLFDRTSVVQLCWD